MSKPTRVAIALGSNLGDRHAYIEMAVERLKTVVAGLSLSTLHPTVPVGVPGPQPMFLNAAAVGDTTLSAFDLMRVLLDIEQDLGRQRPFPGASRTLDLDLVLFGDAIIDEPTLKVPHPRFRERAFVLAPLVEIAPDLRDPVTSLTVAELWEQLRPARPAPDR